MDEPKEVTIQNYKGWEDFYNIEKSEKLDFFIRNGRILDILFAQQFDRAFLDSLCRLATQIRRMALTKMGACFPTSAPCCILFSPLPAPLSLFSMPATFWE